MPYSLEDLDDGNQKNQRIANDLKKQPFIEWHIDKKQIGVGGDNSWGARIHRNINLILNFMNSTL